MTFEAAYVGRLGRRLLQQRDLAMPLDLKDPKSGVDYFTAATAFAKLADANTPVSQVPNMPYWQNLFPKAAGVTITREATSSCGGAPRQEVVANPTATQAMYELFYCNWGSSTFGASNFVNIFDSYCFPACANINGVDTPYAFYNTEFSALYAWSSIGNSTYNAGQFMLRSRQMHGLQFDFNYVYSKSIDEGSDAERATTFGGLSAIINTWDPSQMRGPSDFDLRTRSIPTGFMICPLAVASGLGTTGTTSQTPPGRMGNCRHLSLDQWVSVQRRCGRDLQHQLRTGRKGRANRPVHQGLTYVDGLPYAFNIGAAGQADPSYILEFGSAASLPGRIRPEK